jgi:hypothetical protein
MIAVDVDTCVAFYSHDHRWCIHKCDPRLPRAEPSSLLEERTAELQPPSRPDGPRSNRQRTALLRSTHPSACPPVLVCTVGLCRCFEGSRIYAPVTCHFYVTYYCYCFQWGWPCLYIIEEANGHVTLPDYIAKIMKSELTPLGRQLWKRHFSFKCLQISHYTPWRGLGERRYSSYSF